MKKQEVPKVVADVLKEISSQIVDFNANFNNQFKLVAKSSKSFLLKIYPIDYEFLFFQIDSYSLRDFNDETESLDVHWGISINKDSYPFIAKQSRFTLPNSKFIGATGVFEDVFQDYLSTLEYVYKAQKDSENIELDFSEIFNLEYEEEILPSEPNHFESADKVLPYSLKQLAVKDFQGIKELSIDAIPVDSQWIFLVGENGFGKTTVLQSIFLGLNGSFDGNLNLLEDKHSSIQVEYKRLDDSLINNAKTNENRLEHLAAYGPGRLNLQGAKSENVEDRNNTISYNLFNSDGFLFNINAELMRFELREKKRFNLLKKAFCTLIPNIADIRFNQETDQIEYIEQEINADNEDVVKYQPLPFRKLASGFKSIIALAGDMIVRLSKNQPDVKDPSELKGIVIIDEIDLHLHPKLQKQLIGQFSKVFPKIQFIVSTHSPIPLLGAAVNSVILKVTRTQAEGIKIENVKIDLKNLTPNLVLTSGIFDMEDFVSIQNESPSEIRTEDSFAEMEKNDRVEERLKSFEVSNRQFPDELFIPKSQKIVND